MEQKQNLWDRMSSVLFNVTVVSGGFQKTHLILFGENANNIELYF